MYVFCLPILTSCGGSDSKNLEYIILQNETGSIRGEADYYNSDFIKMNTTGSGTLSIEIIPDYDHDIDCGLTSSVGASVFSQNNFIRDDNYVEISDESNSSACNLIATFNSDREFYLFIDIADAGVSVPYTINYSFNFGESMEYAIMQNETGSITGEADYYNSDFIKMNTIGSGTLVIDIIPDNYDHDIDCGLTSSIGSSMFSQNNFIRDDNYVEISDESYSRACNLLATFNSDREFYLFVDIADAVVSVPYTINYSFNTN
jgi:hypothetical protein